MHIVGQLCARETEFVVSHNFVRSDTPQVSLYIGESDKTGPEKKVSDGASPNEA